MNDAYTTLRVRREAGIARVTLDNPPVNVLDVALMGDLRRLLTALRDDDSVRVIVFDSANPEFFIAHVDMSLGDTPDALDELARDLPDGVNIFQAVGELLRHQPQVTIVKLAGKARGGGAESVDRLARNIAALPDGVVAAAKYAIIPRDHADGLARENDAGAGLVFRSATAQLMGAGLARGGQPRRPPR